MPAPTSQEQYLLELINEARLDPLAVTQPSVIAAA
jgi:hypothetical protein